MYKKVMYSLCAVLTVVNVVSLLMDFHIGYVLNLVVVVGTFLGVYLSKPKAKNEQH